MWAEVYKNTFFTYITQLFPLISAALIDGGGGTIIDPLWEAVLNPQRKPVVSFFSPLLARHAAAAAAAATHSQLADLIRNVEDVELCLFYASRVEWMSLVGTVIKNEMQLRRKSTAAPQSQQLPHGWYRMYSSVVEQRFGGLDEVNVRIENGDGETRAKLVLSELASMIQFSAYYSAQIQSSGSVSGDGSELQLFAARFESPIFSTEAYLNEIDYILSLSFDYICNAEFGISSVRELICALTCSKFAARHILSLICNLSCSNAELTQEIIEIFVSSCNDKNYTQVSEILDLVSGLSQGFAAAVRAACLRHQKLAARVISTSLDHTSDIVTFLNASLRIPGESLFLSLFLQQNLQSPVVERLKREMRQLLVSMAKAQLPVLPARIAALLSCFCTLAALGIYFLDNTLYDSIVAICLSPQAGQRIRNLSLCLLLYQLRVDQSTCNRTLEHICSNFKKTNTSVETLLLLATYFHREKPKACKKIAKWIQSTVGLDPAQSSNDLYKLEFDVLALKTFGTYMTDSLWPSSALAREILKIQPRKVARSASSEGEEWFVLQCVHSLLKGRVFHRLRENGAATWVYQQILCCTDDVPLPRTIPKIIIELVNNSSLSLDNSTVESPFRMNLLSEEQITSVLSSSATTAGNLTPKILIVFYLLMVNSKYAQDAQILLPGPQNELRMVQAELQKLQVELRQQQTEYHNALAEYRNLSKEQEKYEALPAEKRSKQGDDAMLQNGARVKQLEMKMKQATVEKIPVLEQRIQQYESRLKIAESKIQLYESKMMVYEQRLLEQCDLLQLMEFLKRPQRQQLLGVRFTNVVLGLIADKFSHLFHINTLIISEERSVVRSPQHKNFLQNPENEKVISQALKQPEQQQQLTKTVLDAFCCCDDTSLLDNYKTHILSMLPSLFSEEIEHYVLVAYVQLWQVLYKHFPVLVSLRTVNALRMQADAAFPSHSLFANTTANVTRTELSHEDICKNLLLLFEALDQRMIRKPPLLGIFLQLLGSYMTASRNFVMSMNGRIASKRDMCQTFISTQESAVIQILLELCLDRNNQQLEKGDFMVVRQQICRFIHQRFTENVQLLRLVHFQTYDPSLLPITVNSIESMHVCMDFVYELLGQPSVEKQVFGLQLTSYVCEKFPLLLYMNQARASIETARQFGSQGPCSTSSDKRDCARACLQPLARFARSYKTLSFECVKVMKEIVELHPSLRSEVDEALLHTLQDLIEINA